MSASKLTCFERPAQAVANHVTEICVFPAASGWVPFLMPSVALLSLLVTAAIAIRALRNNRAVARQKATLDLIEKRESTEYYRLLSRTFYDLQKTSGFMHLVDPSDADKATRKAVFDYLNHYEMIAIGLRQDILDESIYRAWMEGAFVRDWNAAADFIQRERWKADLDGNWSYRAVVFENYQHIATKWSPEARKIQADSSAPPQRPARPGDDALPSSVDPVQLSD